MLSLCEYYDLNGLGVGGWGRHLDAVHYFKDRGSGNASCPSSLGFKSRHMGNLEHSSIRKGVVKKLIATIPNF